MDSSIESIISGMFLIVFGFIFLPVFNALSQLSTASPNFSFIAGFMVVTGVGLIVVGFWSLLHD